VLSDPWGTQLEPSPISPYKDLDGSLEMIEFFTALILNADEEADL